MDFSDIIIIGAGASGLMAARTLSKTGMKVNVLEGRKRTGGRIHTLYNPEFQVPVEAGAEFIHGNLPITKSLLKEAGISFHPVEGKMTEVRNGRLKSDNAFGEYHHLLVMRLKELKQDIPVHDFLNSCFPGEKYLSFRNSLESFVEGYDAADTTRASTFALRDEWLADDDDEQYRIQGGYARLTGFLEEELTNAGGTISLSSIVKNVDWQKGKAEIRCENGKVYTSEKVIVTVPLGVLNTNRDSQCYITFTPALTLHFQAAGALGFGSVLKTIFQFSDPFWTDKSIEKNTLIDMSDTGFIFSDAVIPTWWTQLPQRPALLTGWLAGPRVHQFISATDEAIRNEALTSLSHIFQVQRSFISDRLKAAVVFNWSADPFTCGAYAYATVNSKKHINFLQKPVGNTIYFAGEALYTGTATGTVEAALESGLHAAGTILAQPFM